MAQLLLLVVMLIFAVVDTAREAPRGYCTSLERISSVHQAEGSSLFAVLITRRDRDSAYRIIATQLNRPVNSSGSTFAVPETAESGHPECEGQGRRQ